MPELRRLEPAPPMWVDPIYRRLSYADAPTDVWLREDVVERLRAAAEAVSVHGHGLLVWDGWRPIELQRTLYAQYREELARTTGLEGERLGELVSRFVTDPDRRVAPPAHGTGGAVDLTLCDPATGEPRDMGGAFDELTTRSEPLYYDDHPDPAGYAALRHTLREVPDRVRVRAAPDRVVALRVRHRAVGQGAWRGRAVRRSSRPR